MMYIARITRRKSLPSKGFGRRVRTLKMGGSVSHFALGPPPHPPRARVTATANIFQREVLKFRVHCRGVSHFSDAKKF
jgi:hypothetical protein